jgi:hypothetical protein
MPIALRADCDAAVLRSAARRSCDAGQIRRLLALPAIYDGATRTGSVSLRAFLAKSFDRREIAQAACMMPSAMRAAD